MTYHISPTDSPRSVSFVALLHWLVEHNKMDKDTAREIYKKQSNSEFEEKTKYIWHPDV